MPRSTAPRLPMVKPPVPDNEAERLRSLRELGVLDSEPEREFDALVKVAAAVCGVPISLVSLVDEDRQWFKANVGLEGVTETSREVAFCAHAILGDGIFEVPDATQDPRFSDNPLVTGQPDIRFYAGAPLRRQDGATLGTLCVIDSRPRRLDPHQREVLGLLAAAATQALEGRRALQAEHSLRVTADRAAAVLRNSVDAIVVVDLDGTVQHWNAAAHRLFGFAPEQMLGQSVDRLVPRHRGAERGGVAAALQQHPQGLTYETVRLDCRGDPIPVSISLAPVLDQAGGVRGATQIIRDIREQARLARAIADSEARFRGFSDGVPIGVFATDAQGRCTYTNARWQQIYGIDFEKSLGDGWTQTLHPDDRQAIFAAWQRSATARTEFDMEFRVQRPDGDVRHVRARARCLADEDDLITGFIGSVEDITELRQLTTELAEQHELLKVTLASIGDAVVTTDARGVITWLNPVAERLTGWLISEATGRPLEQVFHIVHEDSRKPTENPVSACLRQGKVVGLAGHTVLISRDGSEYGIEDSAAPIRNAEGTLLGAVLVFHDVTEQRRLSGEMSYRATHDALTGLVNRSEFEVRLRRTLDKAHDERSQHALMYIDLDQFKLVNDACGHTAGDQLLQQVARLLGDAVRTRDTLARLGGDEFAVILEHCTTEQAQRVAQQVCERMDEFRFLHDGRRFRIGASIGLVPVDTRWTSAAAVMQTADTACYAAKEGGRNRVHTWFDTDQAMRVRSGEMQWATRLTQALDDGRFVLFAQRIEPLRSERRGLHAEVLLRLVDADGTLVPPGAFLPAAERFNLSDRIDCWVLRKTVQLLRDGGARAAIDTLCVNLSGRSVGDRAFHRQAIEILSTAGAEVCERLCFEITETAAVTSMADAALFVEQVRRLGVRIALDDFGSGASSFGYLKSLTVDILKIDGQFVRDIVDDPLDDAAVRCFVDVARVVGVQTVAEFVDRPEVLARLREIGVDHAQGFLLHRPEPLEGLLGDTGVAYADGSVGRRENIR